MTGEIAFVESQDQLAYVPSHAKVIALNPMVELSLDGLSRPEDYFDVRVLEKESSANFSRVEHLCRCIDGIVQEFHSLAAEFDLRPARFNYYQLKVLYDAFYMRTFQLIHIFEKEKPQRVFFFESPEPNLNEGWWSYSESFYNPIIKLIASESGVEYHEIFLGNRISTRGRRDKKTTLISSYMERGLRAVKNIKKRTHALIGGQFVSTSYRALLLDFSYDMKVIARDLPLLGCEVWVWEDGAEPSRLGGLFSGGKIKTSYAQGVLSCEKVEEITQAIAEDKEINDLWSWWGYSLWPIVKERFARIADQCLPRALKYTFRTNRLLDEIEPDVVLVSSLVDERRQIIANASRLKNIPVLLAPHGIWGQSHIPIHFYQNEPVDGYILSGQGTLDYLKKNNRVPPWTIVAGAPAIEDGIKSAPTRTEIRRDLGLSNDRPVVLYLSSNMYGNHFYFSHVNVSDSDYFYIQKRIVGVLGQHEDYQIVIKGHPSSAYQPLEYWVARQGWEHVSYITEPSFQSLINLADIFVVDVPATSVIEALQSNCNLYIYNNSFQWELAAKEALEKCSFFADDIDVFCNQLAADLGTGEAMAARLKNTEYSDLFFFQPPSGAARFAAESIIQYVADR